MTSVLVVDDDADLCEVLCQGLAGPSRTVEMAHEDVGALSKIEEREFDLALVDLDLRSRRDGLDILRAIRSRSPRTQVILMTGFGSLESAVEGIRAGAYDYISKPFEVAALLPLVERALATGGRASAPPRSEAPLPVGLAGRTAVMIEVFKQIALAADASSPVLIVGETGTGKELVARALHGHARRAASPFEALNCAAVPETLLSSELFGHVRGAFTGAATDKKGLFELANGGTIFLDEIGETTPALQASLLRVLQEGEIRPVGGSRTVRVTARVLAATNRDLAQEVAEKRFRPDLYYRLSAFVIQLPPLRERHEDIPLLAAAFLQNACSRNRKSVALAPAALAALRAHSWPGNVRELENTVERLVIAARTSQLSEEDVRDQLRAPQATLGHAAFVDLPTLGQLERRYMKHVLEVAKGNRTRAAEILGIDRRTLYRKASRYGFPLAGDEENGT